MTDDEILAAARTDPDARPLGRDAPRVARQDIARAPRDDANRIRGGVPPPHQYLARLEQHRSVPDAPARALLLAIERDPKVMRRLLAETAA
jgi:putative transcriptional regulator